MEKLTVKKIEEDNKKYNKTTRFDFELDDKKMYVDIYQDFSPKKIKTLIQDYLTDLEVISTELEGDEMGALGGKDFLYFYMILHFTKMLTEKQKANLDIHDKLEIFDTLLTNGLFEEIIMYFPIDSVSEVNDALVFGMDEYISKRKSELENLTESDELGDLEQLVAPLLAIGEKVSTLEDQASNVTPIVK